MNGGDFKGFANSMLRDIVGVDIGNLCVDDFCLLKIAIAHNILVVTNNVVKLRDHNPAVTVGEVDEGITRGKIYAIKAYKERTGVRLLDAKRAIEDYFSNHNLKFKV